MLAGGEHRVLEIFSGDAACRPLALPLRGHSSRARRRRGHCSANPPRMCGRA